MSWKFDTSWDKARTDIALRLMYGNTHSTKLVATIKAFVAVAKGSLTNNADKGKILKVKLIYIVLHREREREKETQRGRKD